MRRRLPILVLLLFPAQAQADKHNMECFSGISREPEASATAYATRLSCGRRIEDSTTYASPSQSLWSALAGGADQDADIRDKQSKAWMRAVFVFVEAADYGWGGETGHFVDGLTLGARYYIGGQKTFEPFVYGSFGVRRPPRENPTEAEDSPFLGAAALGGGADIESNIWFLGGNLALRLQVDVAGTHPEFGLHLRPTVGVSWRYEKHK